MLRRDFLGGVRGADAAWPVAARAQNARESTIGVLAATPPLGPSLRGFHDGLRETGFVEGRNLKIWFHSADGDFDRLPALAADLVNRQVAVIVAMASPVPARVAKAATSTIPIVFAYGGDPIADNLVSNFNRPEGNVTGATFMSATLTSKRVELLNEVVPGLTDIAILVNPKGTLANSQISETQEAIRRSGQRLHVLKASSASEIDSAFTSIGPTNAKALLVSVDPALAVTFRDQIVALAARYKVPAMYGNLQFGEAGGLIIYGADAAFAWRQAGIYAGRILNGEKPADLPVIQPTKFQLVVNLKTAKALGLTIPETFLVRADEVIE